MNTASVLSHNEHLEHFIALLSDDLSSNGMTFQFDVDPQPIETESQDGFIAFTNGGFTCTLAQDLWSDIGSGGVPVALKPWADNLQEQCLKDFEDQHGFDPYQTDDHDKVEMFWEFESEWWCNSPAVYYWKARAIVYEADNPHRPKGAPECDCVLFDAYLCDDEYGRDYIEWLQCYNSNPDRTHGKWSKVVALNRVNETIVTALAADAFESLKFL